ncbi:threonylcarbamoyl-AMP synthase [Candidatus Bathyarchaeota archaeon]|nr:threonylcarbamoyl-AMP synthase [Candidatus Bathyarchaeota archaeon]MBS7612915.1 threonylcarbamoyl-AMP synthase [Candidatus Bathyarchaeota archaeon]MBS7617797.1 threonylcarbamoyl-AMP synthase [Candidatus Bathyarchaeota archaeon]
MKIVKVSEIGFTKAVEEAVRTLIDGGIVVYPTETCYGLAAAIDDIEAVRRIYLVKRRPFNRPLTILVASVDMWREYAYLSYEAMKLIKRFLPGPLTIVLWKKATVPDVVNPMRIGARISSHTLAQAIVERLEKPITATSANIHGDKEPYNANDVVRDVDLILDFGELPKHPPSTIVDLTVEPPVIQRTYPNGPFTEEEILKAITED